MSKSSRGSVFRKVSAKERTDFKLAKSNCMYSTSLFPLSWIEEDASSFSRCIWRRLYQLYILFVFYQTVRKCI